MKRLAALCFKLEREVVLMANPPGGVGGYVLDE
jgi:hypothetical protein